nr:MAG TPA: Replication associated protein [Microviridae sp.]
MDLRRSGQNKRNSRNHHEIQKRSTNPRSYHKKNQGIMCYFTKKVLNKRFLPNRKNRWNPPVCTDERFRYVEVECGHCFECRKKKRREWKIRNYEQLKETPHAVFFTGTVSPQRYEYICKRYGFKNDGSQDNEIITKIHRLFLERIRKETGKSVKHWCVTEKGHTNTRRIHLHGLFYAREGQTKWQLTKLLYENWIDGYKYYGRYVNERTINYVSKYMTKKDEDNPDYISIVLCSKGLGANYAKENQLKHRWNKEKTIITYKARNGADMPLPRYYKTQLYTEDQRQLLWLYAEDKGVKWVKGFEVQGANGVNKDYYEALVKQKNEEGAPLHGDVEEEIIRKKAINRMCKLQNLTQRKRNQKREIKREERDLFYSLKDGTYCPF